MDPNPQLFGCPDDPSDEDVSVDLLEESQEEDVSVDLLEDSQPDPPRKSANPYARVGPIANPYARTGAIVHASLPPIELHRSSMEPQSPLNSAVVNAAMLPNRDDYACYDVNIDGEQRRVRLLYGVDENSGGNDEANEEDDDADADDDNDDNVDHFDEDVEEEDRHSGSEGTVVPGTAYDVITASSNLEAMGRSIGISTIDDIDGDHERWIRQSMFVEWGIRSPHEWQIRAVHEVAFSCDRLLYLIAKTGSGKSAVPLTIGSLQTGVTLVMVPLVGLGSDQVNKCQNKACFIEGYHLDEHRGDDGRVLRTRLMAINSTEADSVSIFLYASPQSLQVCSVAKPVAYFEVDE